MYKKQITLIALILLNVAIGAFFIFKYFEYRDYLIAQKAKDVVRSVFTPVLSPSAQKDSQDLDALRAKAKIELR